MVKLGNYDGGKGRLYQKLINLMPPHSLYAEPFIGGGAVLLKKLPARFNVGIDMDGAVIDAWVDHYEKRMRRSGGESIPLDSGGFIVRIDGASVTPHMTVAEPTAASGGGAPPLDMAVRAGIEGIATSGGAGHTAAIVGNGGSLRHSSPETVVMPGSIVENDGTRVEFAFIHGCGIGWLETAVLPDDALIYCDTPYLMGTRSSQRPLYKYEMTVADHVRFLDAVLMLDCMVMISGYWSELYGERLEGWETAVFDAYTRSGRKTQEWVWMNYKRPERLHDYRYLGDDYRERERIKRKAKRWVSGLQRLPRLERLAILAAMEAAGL